MSYLDTAASPGRFAWRTQLAERAVLAGWRPRMLDPDEGPDLLLTRRPRLLWIFAEPPRGTLSAPRYAALVELRACRQDVVVWHPSDIEAVERTLA